MPVRVAFWIMCAFTVEPAPSGIVKQFVIVLVISLYIYGYVLLVRASVTTLWCVYHLLTTLKERSVTTALCATESDVDVKLNNVTSSPTARVNNTRGMLHATRDGTRYT